MAAKLKCKRCIEIDKIKITPPSHTSFAQAKYERKKKRTRREAFLEKMKQAAPRARLMEIIEPHYSQSGNKKRRSNMTVRLPASHIHGGQDA